MIKKLITISLIILFSSILITADDLSDEEIFDRFINYTKEIYLTNARQSLYRVDFQFPFGDKKISARLLGYSLGNLQLHALRGTENYEILLMLEKKIKDAMFSKIDQAARELGYTSAQFEDRKKRAWREFQAAFQAVHDDDMARRTNVKPRNAPNFFNSLRAGDIEADTGDEGETEVDNPDVISDEILGIWTWKNEYKVPNTDRTVRQMLSIDVRRAGTEEKSTAYGPRTVYLYEGYIVEIENVTDEWSRPLAAPGALTWKIRYTSSHQTPSKDYLSYTLDIIQDRRSSFGIRLVRGLDKLEVGRARYYR